MEEFELPLELVREINAAAVACARRACDEFNERTPDRPRFVAGSIGPTTKQTAISTKVDDASYRGVTFDEMADSYYAAGGRARRSGRRHPAARNGDRHAQPQGLPVRDRTAISTRAGVRVPVMISGTFDEGGATFVSGQEVEAFWNAIAHFPMLSVGMNCALGPETDAAALGDAAASLVRVGSVAIPTPACRTRWASTTSARPTWPSMLGEFAEHGWVNIVGGCCGTTPEHIARDRRDACAACKPHQRTHGRPVPAAQRHAAAHAAARQQLPDDRRADERHRLARSSPGSSRTRSTKKPSKSPASRSTAGRTSSTSTWTKPCSTAKP